MVLGEKDGLVEYSRVYVPPSPAVALQVKSGVLSLVKLLSPGVDRTGTFGGVQSISIVALEVECEMFWLRVSRKTERANDTLVEATWLRAVRIMPASVSGPSK